MTLAYHLSVWGTNIDIALSNPPDAQIDALGVRAANFYLSLGANFDIVFTDKPVTDYRAVMTADNAKLKRFNEVCLRNGVLKGGNKLYVSIVHNEADVDRTLAVFKQALEAVARR